MEKYESADYESYEGENDPFSGATISEKFRNAIDNITGVAAKRRVEELEKELEEHKKQISRHELTGVVKWRSDHGKEEMGLLLDIAGRNKIDVWLANIDLDLVHHLNETYGMERVDRTILCFTDAVKDSLRDSDLLLQYGVDEFPFFMPDISEENLPAVFERIVNKYEENLSNEVESGRVPSKLAQEATFTAILTKLVPEQEFGEHGLKYEDPIKAYGRAENLLNNIKDKGRNMLSIEGGEPIKLRDVEGVDAVRMKEEDEDFKSRYG